MKGHLSSEMRIRTIVYGVSIKPHTPGRRPALKPQVMSCTTDSTSVSETQSSTPRDNAQ